MSKDEDEDRWEAKDYLQARMRECHDCHKPTWDYRCTECQAKHKRKHGVSEMVSDAEE